MKAKQAGILSALLASACCIGPLLLVAVGLGSGAAFVGRYHWFLLLAGLSVLTWSWVKYLREKTACDCEQKPMEGARAGLYTLIAATVVVLGFAALNISRTAFATAPAFTQTQPTAAAGLQRVVLPVEGMSCVTCEIGIRSALGKTPGVHAAQVNAGTNTATIDFDPAQANVEQLVGVINSTGYRAKAPAKP